MTEGGEGFTLRRGAWCLLIGSFMVSRHLLLLCALVYEEGKDSTYTRRERYITREQMATRKYRVKSQKHRLWCGMR